MMIRVILHDHLDAVELFCRNHPGVVMGKSQRRKTQEQVGGLFQVFVDAVRGANQEHDIPRKTGLQSIGKLDSVHQLAFFGQDDALVFVARELFFKEGGLLSERLGMVVEFGFLEFNHFERLCGTTQALGY